MICVEDYKGHQAELILYGKYRRSRIGLVERWAIILPPFDCNYRAIPVPIFTDWWED